MSLMLTDLDLDGVARVKNSLDAVDPQDCVTLTQHNTKADKSITITGTNGLVGGGNLSANRQISMQYPELFFLTTAIQSSTSTAYANVTQLVTSSLAVGFYEFRVSALMQSTAGATGLGLRLGNASATISTCYAKWMIAQTSNGTSQSFIYDQLSPTTNVTSTLAPTANTDMVVTCQGTFRVTAAGTVAIQIRSETGTSVSIRPESLLFIKKVA